MRSSTRSVSIAAPADKVFAFVALPENLPRWATRFSRSVRREDERWIVETPQGDVELRIVSDRALGVVDFHLQPAPGVEVVASSRVVPFEGGAEYIFTLLQAPDSSAEELDAQVRNLEEELCVLRGLLEGDACDTTTAA